VNTFIFGDPKGQPRARAFARKMGAKHVARMYDSDVADAWKQAVDIGIEREHRAQPVVLDPVGAFEVKLTFFFRRPKSHYSKGGHVKASAPICHVSKPDADNLAKLVLDRITEGGWIWRDDSQVAKLKVEKYWAITDARIGVYVSIEPVRLLQKELSK
jgi:Holliday junction resolvase RusA-like endonuclease